MSLTMARNEPRLDILQKRIEETLGSPCTKLVHCTTGGHHLIYSTHTDDNNHAFLVRVQWPYLPGAITVKHKMISEISTMYFLRFNTPVPVPSIFGHGVDEDNSVGGEWMIIEPVEGSSLRSIWPSLSPQQRTSACIAVADCWASILQARFGSIGSLYFTGNTFQIGPMSFLPSNNGRFIAPPKMEKCGPFSNARDWLRALCRDDLQFVSSMVPDPRQPEWTAECAQLVESVVIPEGPCSAFVLEHIDFAPHNILIHPLDETNGEIKISAVLDWEGARIVPMWATNPLWRWPNTSSQEEQASLSAIMRQQISLKIPGWEQATGDACRDCRIAYNWASRVSLTSPDWVRTDLSPRFLYPQQANGSDAA